MEKLLTAKPFHHSLMQKLKQISIGYLYGPQMKHNTKWDQTQRVVDLQYEQAGWSPSSHRLHKLISVIQEINNQITWLEHVLFPWSSW